MRLRLLQWIPLRVPHAFLLDPKSIAGTVREVLDLTFELFWLGKLKMEAKEIVEVETTSRVPFNRLPFLHHNPPESGPAPLYRDGHLESIFLHPWSIHRRHTCF